MKTIIALFLLVIGFNVGAAEEKPAGKDQIIDIMPIQAQFRYEDSVDQTRQMQTYKGLFNFPILEINLAYQFKNYRFSFGRSFQTEKTGNPSLTIEKSKTDYLVGAGYSLFHKESKDQKLSLDIFANVFYGITETLVETRLLGISSKSKSEPDGVFAAGGSAVGRFKFFVLEADLKAMYSTNTNPQMVPAFAIRFGGSVNF